MAATDIPAVEPEEQPNPVDGMLDEVVRRFKETGTEITTVAEAERIVQWLRRRDPEVLFAWFEEHMVALLSQRLQMRLLMARRNGRRSVFANGAGPAPFREPAFTRAGYHCAEGQWKVIGNMQRPDWRYIIDDRAPRAVASLFEIELAKRMIDKLSDDATLTREVVSEAELEALEDQARAKATKTIARITRL